MPYSFKLLPDEPILISTISESYCLEHNTDAFLNELAFFLNTAVQPFCYINDSRALKIDAFQDLLVSINKLIHVGGAVRGHPNLIAAMLVSTTELIKRMAAGLGSDTFGNLDIPVFDTMEEALLHARILISQQ